MFICCAAQVAKNMPKNNLVSIKTLHIAHYTLINQLINNYPIVSPPFNYKIEGEKS